TGKKLQLSQGLFVVRDREHFKLQPAQHHPKKIYLLRLEDIKSGLKLEQIALCFQEFDAPDFSIALYLDTQKLCWPLRLRRWCEGDRFKPLGMSGHQSVADHLTNRKVSAAEKATAMVIEDFEERIAAVIFPPTKNTGPGSISEQFKCTELTREV